MTEFIDDLERQTVLLRQLTESNNNRDMTIVFGTQNVFKDTSKMENINITSMLSAEDVFNYRHTRSEAEEEVKKREKEPEWNKHFSLVLQHFDNKVKAKIAIYHILNCVDLDTLLTVIVDELVATGSMSPQVVMSSPMIEAFRYFTRSRIEFSEDNYRKRITPRLTAFKPVRAKAENRNDVKGGGDGNTKPSSKKQE